MTRDETTTNIPKAELQNKINIYKKDSDYISHIATQEDPAGDFWTLVVTLKDE